jgi:pimeloyl-ACP methyl ester carboxylesterase
VAPDYFLTLLAAAGTHSATDVLPSVDVPVLIVAGDCDGFTPSALSRAMYEAIPGAELLMVEGGTHTAPLERPELVAGTVDRFLERAITTPRRATNAR